MCILVRPRDKRGTLLWIAVFLTHTYVKQPMTRQSDEIDTYDHSHGFRNPLANARATLTPFWAVDPPG